MDQDRIKTLEKALRMIADDDNWTGSGSWVGPGHVEDLASAALNGEQRLQEYLDMWTEMEKA